MITNISIGKYFITIWNYESKNEMIEHLSRCKGGYAVLAEPECHSCYTMFKYREYDSDIWFGIGACLESDSFLPPSVDGFCSGLLWLGYNNFLTLFDLGENKKVFDYSLSTTIVFIMRYNKTIVVSSELEAIQMSESGEVISKCLFNDSLESYKIKDNVIMFNTIDKQFEMLLL